MLVTLAFIQTINIPMATSQGSSSAATVFVLCKLVTIVLCYWTEAKEKESVQKSIRNGGRILVLTAAGGALKIKREYPLGNNKSSEI